MDDFEVDNTDFRKLGFKCGVEIHQQIETEKKLFCRCPARYVEGSPDTSTMRHMRPTLSELGEYDGTALMEFKTRKDVIYLLYGDVVCTYEMDDTPPFMVD
jgi:glutamyl-tRNA(Gln) amidotransferase subunit E